MESDKRWILFDDKKPENGDRVIFGTNHISDEKDRLCRPMVMAGWYMDGFYSYLTKQKLTAKYWMPMPVLNN